ncbi:MAG: hypothetical protein ABII79_01345 [bacterium]
MTEGTAKKGMSKGCLVALIVVAAVLLVVIIGGVVIYLEKDSLTRQGASTLVTDIKDKVNQNPAPGVDTVRFNAVADGFVAKLDESEIKVEEILPFLQSTQAMAADRTLDSLESEQLLQSMIDFFPELEQLLPPPVIEDTTLTEDSLVTE